MGTEALYARTSHSNGDQNPETQLVALRKIAAKDAREYVDKASGKSLKGRPEWARMMADGRAGEISSVLVWRLDRAFRSMADAANTLAELRSLGVKFRSATEGFETSTAAGEMMFNLLAAFAQFEHRVISERIKAGQARVRKHGTRSGRPIGWPKGRKRKPWLGLPNETPRIM